MRIEPLLVLVSGEQHTGSLPFATTANGVQFTSSSGIALTIGAEHNSVVLVPAAVLRPWLQPGASWLTALGNFDPPQLVAGCSICAVGSAAALSGGAATCVPIATVRVPAVSIAAARLLQGLNRDALSSNWAFEWHIGGASCTAAVQGAFVLCWAQPLNGSLAAGAAAAAGPAPPPSPSQPCDPASRSRRAASPAASVTAPGPQSNPHCLHLLQSILASLPAAPVAAADLGSAGPCATITAATIASGSSGAPGAQRQVAFPDAAAADADAAADPPRNLACPGATPGRLVSIIGSPFGCLAPFHFSNSHINGAIACAFPPPPTTAATATTAATVGSRLPAAPGVCSAAAGCRCGLGPALYALDAHVFPGMEGALVQPLQLPLASLTAAAGCGPRPKPHDHAASDAADVASCSGGGVTGGGGAHPWSRQPLPESEPQPLALLCTPVSRRADGVQVPLGAAWPHVAAALAETLAAVLRRALGPSAAGAEAAAAASRPPEEAERQQLQLQPVASRPADDGGGGDASWRHGGRVNGSGWRVAGQGNESVRRPSLHGADWRNAGPGGLRPATAGGGGSAVLRAAAAAAGGAAATACGATAIVVADAHATASATSSCAGLAACGVGGLPAWALQAVVLLRCNGSWATGVLVEGRSGILLTTAHLFQRQTAGATAQGASSRPGKRAGGGGGALAHLPCWARVPWVSDGAPACGVCGTAPGSGPEYRWLRARVLYMWSNHLDLAVLQLEPSYGNRWAQPAAAVGRPPAALAAVRETARADDEDTREVFAFRRPAVHELEAVKGGANDGGGGGGSCGGYAGACALDRAAVAVAATEDGVRGQAAQPVGPEGLPARGTYGAGSPVWAVGHSLVGPAAEWPALVSYGCVARVLRGRGGRPTMVVATTTTHAGGSGGALLDSQGRLVGLVTSNARHAGGATLPNMAFCIAAEELQPVIRWAVAAAAVGYGAAELSNAPGLGLSALEELDVEEEDAARIWRLQMPSLDSSAPAGIGATAAAGEAVSTSAPAGSGSGSRAGPGTPEPKSRL